MNYRLTNKPYYKQASNKTEIQIIMDSPYTVITRDVTGDLTNETAEKQIQAVLNQLAVEFDPTDKISEIDSMLDKKAKEVDEFISTAKAEFDDIKEQSALLNGSILELIEMVGSIVDGVTE